MGLKPEAARQMAEEREREKAAKLKAAQERKEAKARKSESEAVKRAAQSGIPLDKMPKKDLELYGFKKIKSEKRGVIELTLTGCGVDEALGGLDVIETTEFEMCNMTALRMISELFKNPNWKSLLETGIAKTQEEKAVLDFVKSNVTVPALPGVHCEILSYSLMLYDEEGNIFPLTVERATVRKVSSKGSKK